MPKINIKLLKNRGLGFRLKRSLTDQRFLTIVPNTGTINAVPTRGIVGDLLRMVEHKYPDEGCWGGDLR